MPHQLTFGKIRIVEWLWKTNPRTGKPDRRTGEEIYREVHQMIADANSPLQVILHRVDSRSAFLARLKRIQQDFETTKRIH